jgi:hypothetical protein
MTGDPDWELFPETEAQDPRCSAPGGWHRRGPSVIAGAGHLVQPGRFEAFNETVVRF